MAVAPEVLTAGQEFSIWKKNTPFLYDLVVSHALLWPSLTVQWSPTNNNLLMGTHTSDSSPNSLMLAETNLVASENPLPGLTVVKNVEHEGEVNKARFMPQDWNKVASKGCGSEVYLFNLEGDEGGRVEMVLEGHENEGYGLSWSRMKEGNLLSGSFDAKICLWDLGSSKGEKVLSAQQVFEAHEEAVEDVEWHVKDANVFGSVGDDHKLMIWDLRSDKPQHSIVAHQNDVNSLSFNPFNEWILATASKDTHVNLFDMRSLNTTLHTFASHTDEVFQVEWSPHHETILASSSADKRINIWDLSKIGDEQAEEDAEDGPPELLFSHGGHTDKISEFCWNPNLKWVLASVAEDNIVQIWQPDQSFYQDDY